MDFVIGASRRREREDIGMSVISRLACIASLALALAAIPSAAADYPAPKDGDWVVRDFRFHTGEVVPELRLHYTTIGAPNGEPVLILHGTTQSGTSLLTTVFAGQLFGPGQPLDANRYYIILPDAVGHGKSSKSSDGLRTKFPGYNYDDMVEAQYRLVTEHLGVRHLRLVLGNSMGGMETWIFARKYPDFMDIAVPMASQPAAMSSRNWMLRRLITDSIRNDPDWMGGNYTKQPRAQFASVFYASPPAGAIRRYTRQRHRARRPTSCSISVSARRSLLTRTMCCINGIHRATTILREVSSGSRRCCSRSIRRTTSVIRPRPACSTAKSSA